MKANAASVTIMLALVACASLGALTSPMFAHANTEFPQATMARMFALKNACNAYFPQEMKLYKQSLDQWAVLHPGAMATIKSTKYANGTYAQLAAQLNVWFAGLDRDAKIKTCTHTFWK